MKNDRLHQITRLFFKLHQLFSVFFKVSFFFLLSLKSRIFGISTFSRLAFGRIILTQLSQRKNGNRLEMIEWLIEVSRCESFDTFTSRRSTELHGWVHRIARLSDWLKYQDVNHLILSRRESPRNCIDESTELHDWAVIQSVSSLAKVFFNSLSFRHLPSLPTIRGAASGAGCPLCDLALN